MEEVWRSHCAGPLLEDGDEGADGSGSVERLVAYLSYLRNSEGGGEYATMLRGVMRLLRDVTARLRAFGASEDPLDDARKFAEAIFCTSWATFGDFDEELILRGGVLYVTPKELEGKFTLQQYECCIVRALALHLTRQAYSAAISWSIPSIEWIERVKELGIKGRVFDVGGGKGLWTLALRRSGIDAACVVSPLPDDFCAGKPFIDDAISMCASTAATLMCEQDALLLSWVPKSTPAFAALLRQFPGDIVLVVSEQPPFQRTTSGSTKFWDTLGACFRLHDSALQRCMPGYTDWLQIYRKKI